MAIYHLHLHYLYRTSLMSNNTASVLLKIGTISREYLLATSVLGNKHYYTKRGGGG